MKKKKKVRKRTRQATSTTTYRKDTKWKNVWGKEWVSFSPAFPISCRSDSGNLTPISNFTSLTTFFFFQAYGIVWKAMDKKSKEIVAVKKIFDAFRNQTDAQRTFREIMFLQAFRDHPNIIRLRGLHKASNNKDIYLVFDYMGEQLRSF